MIPKKKFEGKKGFAREVELRSALLRIAKMSVNEGAIGSEAHDIAVQALYKCYGNVYELREFIEEFKRLNKEIQ